MMVIRRYMEKAVDDNPNPLNLAMEIYHSLEEAGYVLRPVLIEFVHRHHIIPGSLKIVQDRLKKLGYLT